MYPWILALILCLLSCGGDRGTGTAETGLTSRPARLGIRGRSILDEHGKPIRLRGANLEGATPQESADLALGLGMNFCRLRISYAAPNLTSTGAFTPAYQEAIAQWVAALSRNRIWIALEMRTDDATANSPDFYLPDSESFRRYSLAWVGLANAFKHTDYIAGYGILAEPSAEKTGHPDPKAALATFQRRLMADISAVDPETPFILGPNFNYDTMQYRFDDLYQPFDAYRGRLVYAVNMLQPKPWIQDGSSIPGLPDPVAYPEPVPSSFDSLVEWTAGDAGIGPDEWERLFNKRRLEPPNYVKMFCPEFLAWYLQWPIAFGEKFQVPVLIDQFGASISSAGQLRFEEDLVRFAEAHGLHWSRWSYNAGSAPRMLTQDPAAYRFYQDLLRSLP